MAEAFAAANARERRLVHRLTAPERRTLTKLLSKILDHQES
jgi:hypothetical protein